MESAITILAGLVIAVLIVTWLFGLIKKIGGCLIHLLLLGAGLVLLAYIISAFLSRGS
ncbi:MAG: hypothetical protein WBH57_04455 [Anaerolineae bacterium]